MKKLILLFAVALLTTGAFAQKIKIVSGSLNFLSNAKTLNTKFTYEKTKVGKVLEKDYVSKKAAELNAKEKGKGDSWVSAWESDKVNRFEAKFVELFNKYGEEKRVSIDGDNNNYTMIVNVDFIEPGFNVGVVYKDAQVDLTVRIINDDTNEEVAVITVVKSVATDVWGTNFDSAYRIQESYAKAGRELVKFMIKKAKL